MQQKEIEELKKEVERKNEEYQKLSTAMSDLKRANEDLQSAIASKPSSSGTMSEKEKDLERMRKSMAQQLADFEVMKKALMRDLQNRCEKVVELEISLDETREQYNNALRASNNKAQQKKMAFLERNLEQLTNVQKQASWHTESMDWSHLEGSVMVNLCIVVGWAKFVAQEGGCFGWEEAYCS